jgi:CRP/FNR family transcriptional regulator, dissimilatory nitrate respiration regulator
MTLVTPQTVLQAVQFRMRYEHVLRQILFLRASPEPVLSEMSLASEVRRCEKGEVIFLEKDRCLGLVVVLSGGVKVYKLDARGREVVLNIHPPGDSVVDIALFDGGNYPANAEAIQEDTRLLIVPRDRFREIMARNPEIGSQALKAAGIQVRRLLQMVEAQALYPVRARLADYLLEASDGCREFRLNETNEVIAGRVGTVREVVSRSLRSLKESGAIGLCGRLVTIQDEAVLRSLALPLDEGVALKP